MRSRMALRDLYPTRSSSNMTTTFLRKQLGVLRLIYSVGAILGRGLLSGGLSERLGP